MQPNRISMCDDEMRLHFDNGERIFCGFCFIVFHLKDKSFCLLSMLLSYQHSNYWFKRFNLSCDSIPIFFSWFVAFINGVKNLMWPMEKGAVSFVNGNKIRNRKKGFGWPSEMLLFPEFIFCKRRLWMIKCCGIIEVDHISQASEFTQIKIQTMLKWKGCREKKVHKYDCW